ncbi:class I SAM-dependent methyltransferase [Streptomyces sp. NPDC047072]|uniref:class I SAM-dependent methyltransferase n=1 Tax=Streptomyces sp. NPDC047072 TaxID=3154809 RepID=UPI0034035571
MSTTIHWTEDRTARSARWHSESAAPPPARVVVADDSLKADAAYRLACEGTGLLWRGDYVNARQLLSAMGRRVDRKPPRPVADLAETFHLYRRARGHRARVLGRLLVLLTDHYSLTLRRAPDVRRACADAYGVPRGAMVVSLSELLGVLGARQWREKGVAVPALGARIHPHYGVFAPTRSEYVDLVARVPLPAGRRTAFDLGTGTGVLAAVLAHRGFERVVGTDVNPRALSCAHENAHRLGLGGRVSLEGPALFPDGRADLVVCNPPWLPGRPASALDQGVYDPDGAMLHGFLAGLAAHLAPGGEGWLILSDLAELLGLRSRVTLLTAVEAAGLRVLGRTDTRPRHPRATNPGDPLHAARAPEVTSLWRLAVSGGPGNITAASAGSPTSRA